MHDRTDVSLWACLEKIHGGTAKLSRVVRKGYVFGQMEGNSSQKGVQQKYSRFAGSFFSTSIPGTV